MKHVVSNVSRPSPKRTSAEVFAEMPHLRQSTVKVSRGIFVRFLIVVVGVNMLVGTGVIVYDVADHIWTTREHLHHTSNVISRVGTELRRNSKMSDREVVRKAADLTQAPMALISTKDGAIRFATAHQIREKIKLVYKGKPRRGTEILIDERLSWLSGAWTIVPLTERHDLLSIAIRHPEEEGLAQYMTIAAGIIGLGLVLCFFSMLAAANWILKRPLHLLVEQATEALEDQLGFRNNLLHASESVGIVAADYMDHIQIFNRAAERILGYSEAQVRDNKLTLEELKQQSHGPVDSTLDRLPSLVHAREGEEVWLDREGKERLLDVSSNPIMDAEDNFKGRLVTFIDITDRRRLESELHLSELQLMQSAKMATLGEMATGVAHELNQPLNNIGLLASRMAMKLPKPALEEEDRQFYRERLDKVRKQVDRASKIIDHLRTFGRPSGMQLSALDVEMPLQGVADLLSEQLRAHGVTLDLDLPADLPRVIADEGQLEQVVMNLIVNARDALEALPDKDDRTRLIRITAELSLFKKSGEEAVCIHVTDNGCGIDVEEQERIFDPFFSTKEVGKGTGLGLSISYGLVRDFGGQLEVQTSSGRGSTFTIRLKTA